MSQLKQTSIVNYFNKVKRSIDQNKKIMEDKRIKLDVSNSEEECIIVDHYNVNSVLEVILNDDDDDRRAIEGNKTILPATAEIIDITEPDNAMHWMNTNKDSNDSLEILLPVNEVTVNENKSMIVDPNAKNVRDTARLRGTDNKLGEMTEEVEDFKISRPSSSRELTRANDNNNNSDRVRNEEPRPYNYTPKKASEKWSRIKHFNNANNNLSNSSPQYLPKVPSGKTPTKYKNTHLDYIIHQTIENLNLAKQGAIPPNDFDLSEVYSKPKFKYTYSKKINASISTKYEVDGIKTHNDFKSFILLSAICTVLANPINCGYFDEDELDFIYVILTLPEEALFLLARLISRKRDWIKENNIKYPDIKDKRHAMEVLVSKEICIGKTQDLSEALELLDAKEIQDLCRQWKLETRGRNKKRNIQELLKSSKQKPLFPEQKNSSGSLLQVKVNEILGSCIRISLKTWDVIDRIIILLIPYHSKLDIKDRIEKLSDIYGKKITYPEHPGDYFPVFSDKSHLVKYIEATSKLFNVLRSIEKKNWEEVQKSGISALTNLPQILEDESLRFKNCELPVHVHCYMPGYKWLKILDKCIQALKKSTDKTLAVRALNFLLKQQYYMHGRKGRWHTELYLIKMSYYKQDIENTALNIMRVLNEEKLTVIDKVNLLERGNMIYKRKTGGVKETTKHDLMNVLSLNKHYIPEQPPSFEIQAELMPGSGTGKSIWRIGRNNTGDTYGSVENVVLQYYKDKGFPKGIHYEGSLPVTLFFTLFWEELYDINIPGVFVTPYQEAPSDLFTEQFYENRKDKIDTKMKVLEDFNNESFSDYMETRFQKYRQYTSMMSSAESGFKMKEIVYCLGKEGVLGICNKLCENFKAWKAGFPDLFLWNYDTKEHKIIEVKGPNDKLSTKQRLWMDYLHRLGLNTKLCLVKTKSKI
ncbi:fanconi-associated nuclease 1-like isoform X2 [Ceratina calcarata]|uniref:Fanconi-associated nuclease n=1 Tax=Ceratina calcarata TaxID=156304 RepID=A0AAJ7J9M5_9HYME|nr:fanconi-associated nuclease 1-like isoform X2 [Ceratina calcarata]